MGSLHCVAVEKSSVHDGQVHNSMLSTDGCRILTASFNKKARLWRRMQPARQAPEHDGEETSSSSAPPSPYPSRGGLNFSAPTNGKGEAKKFVLPGGLPQLTDSQDCSVASTSSLCSRRYRRMSASICPISAHRARSRLWSRSSWSRPRLSIRARRTVCSFGTWASGKTYTASPRIFAAPSSPSFSRPASVSWA